MGQTIVLMQQFSNVEYLFLVSCLVGLTGLGLWDNICKLFKK